MNIHAATSGRLPATPDEFLRWNESREGKREFVNGSVVEMTIHVTANHARLAMRLVLQLGGRSTLRGTL
ncbi:MAG: Uma2 family endonuclease [Rhizobiaceae bacterium]|jgi:hypothetical protein|nr:Uma2 family endonuclease [Rhizobiaceae bacterium]